MKLSLLPNKFAICKIGSADPIPLWATQGTFFSISKTRDELSIVCDQTYMPDEPEVQMDWRAFKVEGPLDFSLTGILASIANPLAEAKISIFAISTFDTDYVLVKSEKLDSAIIVLRTTGFELI